MEKVSNKSDKLADKIKNPKFGSGKKFDKVSGRKSDNKSGGKSDSKSEHKVSAGHKVVNIILIVIIVLLVVCIVFCILYLTKAWRPTFMKKVFGDKELYGNKKLISRSCSAGSCSTGDLIDEDEEEKKKKKKY